MSLRMKVVGVKYEANEVELHSMEGQPVGLLATRSNGC